MRFELKKKKILVPYDVFQECSTFVTLQSVWCFFYFIFITFRCKILFKWVVVSISLFFSFFYFLFNVRSSYYINVYFVIIYKVKKKWYKTPNTNNVINKSVTFWFFLIHENTQTHTHMNKVFEIAKILAYVCFNCFWIAWKSSDNKKKVVLKISQ